MPVDFYRSQAQLDADAPFSDGVGPARALEAPRNLPCPTQLCDLVCRSIPTSMAWSEPPYRSDHYLLWIGDFLNLPYLLRWKERTELPYDLKVLTKGRRTSIKGMAMTLARARRLGVELDVTQDRINGIAMYEWDPATQRAMMANTKAAWISREARRTSLSSRSLRPRRTSSSSGSRSPPTRTARLPETARVGFAVADVEDQQRWCSDEYWKSTRPSALFSTRESDRRP